MYMEVMCTLFFMKFWNGQVMPVNFKRTRERNTTISGLLLRAEAQTGAVSFKLAVNVIEMGNASTLQLPCIPYKICQTSEVKIV